MSAIVGVECTSILFHKVCKGNLGYTTIKSCVNVSTGSRMQLIKVMKCKIVPLAPHSACILRELLEAVAALRPWVVIFLHFPTWRVVSARQP